MARKWSKRFNERSPGSVPRRHVRGAFFVIFGYALFWLRYQPDSFDLHAIVSLLVWSMTLLIQRSWHRDTQAIHAKLDELLRATEAARNELAKIDQEQPEAIERSRAEEHEAQVD